MKTHRDSTAAAQADQQPRIEERSADVRDTLPAAVVDNRASSVNIQRLQDMANSSTRAIQMEKAQRMFTNPGSKRRQWFEPIADNSPHETALRQQPVATTDAAHADALRSAHDTNPPLQPLEPAIGASAVIQGFGLNLGALGIPSMSGLASVPGRIWSALRGKDEAQEFSAEMNGQEEFYQDIDGQLDEAATPQNNVDGDHLEVSHDRLAEVGERLKAREIRQRGLVGSAHAKSKDIFDGTVENHVDKNELWRLWMKKISGGKDSGGKQVDGDYVTRVGTTISRIIASTPGFQLLQDLHDQSHESDIPINFIERAMGENFNMTARSVTPKDGSRLEAIEVAVPAADRYDDAQSFKRSDHLQGGVQQEGQTLTAAPLDTDLFHEFVHAAHYMEIEQRRRALPSPSKQKGLAKEKARNKRAEQFRADFNAYRGGIGGASAVLSRQHHVSEASTIHRRGSMDVLRTMVAQERDTLPDDREETRPVYEKSIRDIDRVQAMISANDRIPSENDYRVAIGLRPRQDHNGVVLDGDNRYSAHQFPEGIVIN
ncbi:hypothetical protein PO883_25250 [Massilia sp. DJPM01]|uniref:hypothetical protein n=1 Tax=Massilia sp. DJPM01 TaxID=3024404 RepID=UPI00259F4E71|nr:hypothetical protein [Massilia sp. DJPM01]MDM5180494.1 hypothetical protein [Massilia sp. DJPM01]